MKSSASFYNVGRGPSVDTVALTEALRQKKSHLRLLMFLKKNLYPQMIRYGHWKMC